MPDRVPKPHPSGTKPPPPPPVDYGKRSFGEALQHGWQNLGTSAVDTVMGAPFGIAKSAIHAGRQALGYDPTQPGFNRLAIRGITDPYMLSDISDTGKQVRNWVGSNFGTPERAWETTKRTIANDPASAVALGLNAAHLVSGGAGALSRAPVIRGSPAAPVLRGVSNVAGAVANPTRTVARVARGVPASGSFVRPDGTLHPKVNAALEEAAPGSSREAGLDPATGQPVNPAFRQQVVDTMTAKGPTPQAAREAILKHHLPNNTPVPRPATTGIEAPPQAQTRAEGLTTNALQASGQQIASGPGLDAPRAFGVDPATGRLAGSTRDARLFTDTPEGVSAFRDPRNPTNPDIDASDARIATHAQDILNAPLKENTTVGWGPAVRTTLAGLAGAGLGTAGAIAGLGHGTAGLLQNLGAGAIDLGIGAVTGGALGAGERFGVEPLFRAGERQAQGWGAPPPGGPLGRIATSGAPAVDAALRAYPLAPKVAPIAPPPEKQPDASDIPDEPKAPPPSDLAPPTTPVESTPAPTEVPPEAPPEAPPAPAATAPPASHGKEPSRIPSRIDNSLPDEWKPSTDAAPQAAGGRVSFADGGHVTGMVDRLMARAEREGKATRTATKPLLALDDNTVAKALAIAGRAI